MVDIFGKVRIQENFIDRPPPPVDVEASTTIFEHSPTLFWYNKFNTG